MLKSDLTMQVASVSYQWASSRAPCDACVEDNKVDTGKEVSAADTYCVDCHKKFCEDCWRQHGKFKLTESHKLVPVNEDSVDKNATTYLTQSTCELHVHKPLDVYCADCKTVLCAICFIEHNKFHEGSHVNKCLNGFRKQIRNNTKAINECIYQAQVKKAELLKAKEEMQRMVKNLECDVENRKDDIKQFADEHANCLLQGLCSKRQSKLTDIQMTTAEINAYLSSLETYNSHCQKIIDEGSPSDICRSVSDLSVRAVELQQQCQPLIERGIPDFKLWFRQSELEEFLEEDCANLIGEIAEEGDLKSKKRSKQCVLAKQSNEMDLLRKEIEIERTEKESLRLAIEQLRINVHKGVEALREQLIKEKANHNVLIERLKQELDNNEIARKVLQTKSEELNQKLRANTTTNSRTNNDQLSEVKPIETNAKKLGKELETKTTVEHRYQSDPVLVQTIRIKAPEEKNKSISGLTILEKELFVASEENSEVEVYDSMTFSFNRRWNLKDLIYPVDIVSCSRNKCLYIFDYKVSVGQSNEILRVDPNGKLIMNWSTGHDCGWGLSVTYESNVILTAYQENKLNEYSPEGRLIREIKLSSDASICHPLHAIKLANGHFLVSHVDHDMHRVCLVDGNGILKKSFGGKRGSTIGQLNEPVYLSVDENGFVMVADFNNSRVLLLDSKLEFKKEILAKTENHRLRYPEKILLDESNGRLFVADNELNNEVILIFNFK